jgi:hypothetical protein
VNSSPSIPHTRVAQQPSQRIKLGDRANSAMHPHRSVALSPYSHDESLSDELSDFLPIQEHDSTPHSGLSCSYSSATYSDKITGQRSSPSQLGSQSPLLPHPGLSCPYSSATYSDKITVQRLSPSQLGSQSPVLPRRQRLPIKQLGHKNILNTVNVTVQQVKV